MNYILGSMFPTEKKKLKIILKKNYPSSESDTEDNFVQKDRYFNKPEYIEKECS